MYWKQEDMDSSFTQKDVHDLFKPSVIVILLETGNKKKCLSILCIFLWNTNCMESKGMRSVVLSTTEAEYIALSEVVKRLISSFNC